MGWGSVKRAVSILSHFCRNHQPTPLPRHTMLQSLDGEDAGECPACCPGCHPALSGDNWTATGQPGPLLLPFTLPRPGQWFGASPRGLGKRRTAAPTSLAGPPGPACGVGHKRRAWAAMDGRQVEGRGRGSLWAGGEQEDVSPSGVCPWQVLGWGQEGWEPGPRMSELQKDENRKAAKHGKEWVSPRDLVPPRAQRLQSHALVPTFSARRCRGTSRGSLGTQFIKQIPLLFGYVSRQDLSLGP